MTPKPITIDEYEILLNKHDWHYARSSCRWTYQAGVEARRELRELAAQSDEFEAAYKEVMASKLG